MSLVYIVDGYNVIKRSGFFRDKVLKDARDAFFSYIDCYKPQGSFNNKLIIVFDGSSEVFGFVYNYPFEVVFTSGETADDKIKEIVSLSLNPKNIVVVTDDKGLGLSVRSCGAKIMATTEFLNKNRQIKPCGKEEARNELNIVEREKITRELGKIWLDKKSY